MQDTRQFGNTSQYRTKKFDAVQLCVVVGICYNFVVIIDNL